MNDIFIHGLGAVSPAGWGVPALRQTVAAGKPLPVEVLNRPGGTKQLAVRGVPAFSARPAFLSHPRLRRAGAMSQHTVAAALEALGADALRVQAGELRLGIIVSTMVGSVTYSRRFYEEVLQEPSLASPLMFPETVSNAPASHLAAFLNCSAINYTLAGDEGTFLQGLALAAGWLADDRVDGCVVIGAEEQDWLVANALRLFQKSAVCASGAGALYLKLNVPASTRLSAVTDALTYTQSQPRRSAAHRLRQQLGTGAPHELLCDSDATHSLWHDWPGPRLTPKTILGDAFTASAAWHCVLACDAISHGQSPAACVSIVGSNQQAIGARFTRA